MKPLWQLHDERIKQLMEKVGMPNSMGLYQAFKQFANEFGGPLDAWADTKPFPRDPTPEMMAHWRKGRVIPAYVGSQEKADAAAIKRWHDFYDAINSTAASGVEGTPK